MIRGQTGLVLGRVGGGEKGERVTTGGKGRGEIGGEAGEVTGVVADAPTTDGLGKGMERLVDGVWQLEKWRYCWWLVGLMWTEVQKSDLSLSFPLICNYIIRYLLYHQ